MSEQRPGREDHAHPGISVKFIESCFVFHVLLLQTLVTLAPHANDDIPSTPYNAASQSRPNQARDAIILQMVAPKQDNAAIKHSLSWRLGKRTSQ